MGANPGQPQPGFMPHLLQHVIEGLDINSQSLEGEAYSRQGQGILQLPINFCLTLQVHIPDDDEDYDDDESEADDYEDSHVSHTGQVFFAEDMYSRIEALDPYTSDLVTRLHLSDDGIYNNDPSAILTITQLDMASIKYGVIGAINMVVDPDATPPVGLRKRK